MSDTMFVPKEEAEEFGWEAFCKFLGTDGTDLVDCYKDLRPKWQMWMTAIRFARQEHAKTIQCIYEDHDKTLQLIHDLTIMRSDVTSRKVHDICHLAMTSKEKLNASHLLASTVSNEICSQDARFAFGNFCGLRDECLLCPDNAR